MSCGLCNKCYQDCIACKQGFEIERIYADGTGKCVINGTAENPITKDLPGYKEFKAVVCPELKFGGFMGLVDSTGEEPEQEPETEPEPVDDEEPPQPPPQRPDTLEICSYYPPKFLSLSRLIVGQNDGCDNSESLMICSSMFAILLISFY